MELTPEEKRRIYEEEKARIEAEEQIRKEIPAQKQHRAGQTANRIVLGCLGIIGLFFLLIVLSLVFSSADRGKDWNDVMYEVSIFYEVTQVEDTPDRKVWMGKVREGSRSPATLTATRLPNGKWKTELKHLDIRIR